MRENGAKMYNFQKEDRLDRIDFQDTYIDLYNIYHDEENIDKEVTQANCESTNNSIWSSINGVGVNLCRENLNSIVTKVTDKKTGETTLLLADAETPIQNDIIDEVGQADTIKAAHHGDATGFSKEFLDSVNPSVIVTTHYDNEYSASPELLDYATSHNIPVYNTGPNWYHSSLVSNYNNGKASIVPSSESWTMVNGNWQYLDTNGTPTTGWFQDPSSFNWYYLDENGDMVTGWQELTWNGKKDWYYFDEDSGIMQYDTDIDGRHLNSNGTWDGEGSTPQKSEPSKGQSSNPSSTPSSTQADDGCVATTFFGTACGKEGIFKVLSFALDIMTIGIGILAVIGILVVGVQYLTAGDNVGQTEKAKRRMLEIIIGLVIYIVVYGLLKWLLPGFEDSLKEIAQHTFNLIA